MVQLLGKDRRQTRKSVTMMMESEDGEDACFDRGVSAAEARLDEG